MIPAAFCLYFMVRILNWGSTTMQNSQKLDGVYRGPIHTTFAMLVNGLVTVRVHKRIGYFKQDFNSALEKCANATFCYAASNRWIGVRLDMICIAFTLSTTILALVQKGRVNAELLVITMQIVTDLIAIFSVSLRMAAETQNFMTSS